MKVELVGPIGDFSGYGHDCRQTAQALLKAGVDLYIKRIVIDKKDATCDFGAVGSTLRPYVRTSEELDVQIIHAPPHMWGKYVRGDCLTIGKTAWETDTVDPRWIRYIRNAGVQQLWVPTQSNADIFQSELPNASVIAIPHAHDVDAYDTNVDPLDLSMFGVADDVFVFGSAFQWTARKNPEGLITAFISEFSSDESVALLLKTHTWDTTEDATTDLHEKLISAVKSTGFSGPRGRIALLPQALPFEMMLQLYKRIDCGVYPFHGEGWGLHISESMLMERACIVTNWSGPTEYCDESDSYLLGYQMKPVTGMEWSRWHNSSQSWADPDLTQLRETMRMVFEQRGTPAHMEKGMMAREKIYNNYSLNSVGNKMKDLMKDLLQ